LKDFTMKPLLTALIALIAATSLLAGCGQKGPLYLPEETSSAPAQSQ
jgi:predicted small lipoprotein YifL